MVACRAVPSVYNCTTAHGRLLYYSADPPNLLVSNPSAISQISPVHFLLLSGMVIHFTLSFSFWKPARTHNAKWKYGRLYVYTPEVAPLFSYGSCAISSVTVLFLEYIMHCRVSAVLFFGSCTTSSVTGLFSDYVYNITSVRVFTGYSESWIFEVG